MERCSEVVMLVGSLVALAVEVREMVTAIALSCLVCAALSGLAYPVWTMMHNAELALPVRVFPFVSSIAILLGAAILREIKPPEDASGLGFCDLNCVRRGLICIDERVAAGWHTHERNFVVRVPEPVINSCYKSIYRLDSLREVGLALGLILRRQIKTDVQIWQLLL